MASANCELESSRIGALLEGVTKDRRMRKCASAVGELESTFSHSRGINRTSVAHRGCFETDDSNSRLILLIRNAQRSLSGPRAGANRTPRARSAACTRETVDATCFPLPVGHFGTRLLGTPHPVR